MKNEKSLTKEEWQKLENDLHSYITIRLVCDDNVITLEKHIPREGSVKFMTFVNGVFKGSWLIESDHPFRKYMYCRKKTIYGLVKSKKELDSLVRKFGKKFAERFKPTEYIFATPYYPSFAAFRKNMIANCSSIEIFSADTHQHIIDRLNSVKTNHSEI